MRSFQWTSTFDPVPASVVALLHRIDLAAGRQDLYAGQVPQLLDALRARARVESVTASSAIEDVVVPGARIPALLADRPTRYRNRSEAEFAGYRMALDHLHQTGEGELTVGRLLHLHRLLFSQTEGPAGAFKSDDNLVVDIDTAGKRTVRFEPVPASETPFYATELVERTNAALAEARHHPLLVIAAFALDLLCIHPFVDGNGRVARLVSAQLLERTNYAVGRYVSIEQLVYETGSGYYAALAASTAGWFDDGHHSLWPWATYLLTRVDDAYRRFEANVADATDGGSKQDRVRQHVLHHAATTFTVGDLRRALPGISDQTIRLVLAELRRAGRIAVDGPGRSARWRRADSGENPGAAS